MSIGLVFGILTLVALVYCAFRAEQLIARCPKTAGHLAHLAPVVLFIGCVDQVLIIAEGNPVRFSTTLIALGMALVLHVLAKHKAAL